MRKHFPCWLLLLFAFSVMPPVGAQAQITLNIDYAAEYQEIDNFGASDAWSIQPAVTRWLNESDEAAIDRLADYLFSTETGIGLSAWRFNIGAGSAEQGRASRIPDRFRRAELLMPAPDALIDRTKQQGQIRFLQEAHERRVVDFVAFANSPPVWATKNGLSHPGDGRGIGSSNLNPNRREDFAKFLVAVVKYLRGPSVGVPVNYVSPINEPTWDWEGQTQEGNRYNMADLKSLYREVERALVQADLDKEVQIDGPEAVEYTAALGDLYKRRFDGTVYAAGMNSRNLGLFRNYIDELLGDPEMRRILHNKISLHGYFSEAWADRLGKLRDLTRENVHDASPGAKIWMSELCILGGAGDVRSFEGRGFDVDDMEFAIHVARILHRDLVRLNVSAWHWWLALTPYNYKDGLLKIARSLDARSLQPSKLLWTVGNFSRFIRPGYRRIGIADIDDVNGVMASAYKSPDDSRIVIVIVNAGQNATRASLAIEGLPQQMSITKLDSYTTDAENDLARSTVGKQFSIPSRSTVTLVAEMGR
jgi:O-glycosyl hydrolase